MGKVRDPVPVTGFAPNFSPIPWIAPPPFVRGASLAHQSDSGLAQSGASLFPYAVAAAQATVRRVPGVGNGQIRPGLMSFKIWLAAIHL